MSVPQNLQTPPTSSLSPHRCVKPNSSNTFKKLIPFFICHTYIHIYIYIHTHILSPHKLSLCLSELSEPTLPFCSKIFDFHFQIQNPKKPNP